MGRYSMIRQVTFTFLFGWFTTLVLCMPSFAATLSVKGKAAASIVLGSLATESERTAAEELASYLSKVTGGKFAIVKESNFPSWKTGIYVGSTLYAKSHNMISGAYESEQWAMRTIDKNIVLIGGSPRGTLYAVYHFLEDIVGVHWWNPFEESVPLKPTLVVDEFNKQGKPAFAYRGIYKLFGRDSGRFAVHNRLNGLHDGPIAAKYGGGVGYGLPYHVHTFYRYIPTASYFKTHPEWFSLIDGKRSAKQLCLTNQELRNVFVMKLKAYIRKSAKTAQKEGRVAPLLFSISQNDGPGGMCQCEPCQAIAKTEGSESGPLLDFVNYIADSVKDEYPDIYVTTLAYNMTQKPPKNIKPRDNVVIRLCDTSSDFTKSIIHTTNHEFKDVLSDWAKIAKNLQIWDYAVTYTPYYGLPLPTVHTYASDYQYYVEHNVKGVFTEFEYPILADMRDLKLWIMVKLLENPYSNYEHLLEQFTDVFYGQAGLYIRQYLKLLETASEDYLSIGSFPQRYRHINLTFIRKAMVVFDQAEHTVKDNPIWLRRVQHARLPLDRAALVFFPRLLRQWIQEGGKLENIPLDRGVIAKRCLSTWESQINLRIKSAHRVAERTKAKDEVAFLLARRGFTLPEKFKNVSPDQLFDYTAGSTRNHKNIAKKIPDNEAETKVTNRLELSNEEVKKYRLPMVWGLYDRKKKRVLHAFIRGADVPGPGYHWYKMGPFKIGSGCCIFFFRSWFIQLDVDNAFDPSNPEQEFEIWARIKFEGPEFPHGKIKDNNAISIERVVLKKK